MADISNKFLRPNNDGQYYAQQSQIFYGLWTPYGVLSPLAMGIWPDGSVAITYNMKQGVKFYDSQKKKIKYVEERGVEVRVMHPEEEAGNE